MERANAAKQLNWLVLGPGRSRAVPFPWVLRGRVETTLKGKENPLEPKHPRFLAETFFEGQQT
jgi:hypothetical protein